jgi:hypothetical protein
MKNKDKLQRMLVELKEQRVKNNKFSNGEFDELYAQRIEEIGQVLNIYDLLTARSWELNIAATLIFTLSTIFTDYELMYARNNQWYYQSTNKFNAKTEVQLLTTSQIIAEVKQF